MTRRIASVLALFALVAAIGTLVPTTTADASRDFGDDPLDDVLFWAAETDCGRSQAKLAAIMLAPIYPETGASTAEAAGPMTLSRWDTQTSLHSFSDPSSYVTAFWHPGVGLWQFDSAGGWGMTAADRIDTTVAAAVASDLMANRYCADPSLTHVWLPWNGCSVGRCHDIYEEIYQGGSLVGLDRDPSVGSLGGVEKRTCTLGGGSRFHVPLRRPGTGAGGRWVGQPRLGADTGDRPVLCVRERRS